MRSATSGLLVVTVAGLVALLVIGLARDSALVYTLGVAPQGPIVKLPPRGRACQSAISPPDGASFERVGFYPRGATRGGPGVQVEIEPAAGGRALGRGELTPGYPAATPPPLRRVDVGKIRPREPITVCFTNRGDRPLELWGTAGVASPSTSATVNGRPVDVDMGVTLDYRRSRSLVGLLPATAARASVFHPRWVSPPVYGLLAAIVLLGVPALLGIGLRHTATDD
jgi:hypothetical protein